MKLMVSACLLGTCCRYDGGGYDPMIFQNRLKKCTLVPVCPEQLGGLPTPRSPAERVGEHVRNCEGADVTAAFFAGASAALELAQREGCRCALLKERSPSCGLGRIYDGTFTGTVVPGNGVAAELLLENGVKIYGESRISELLK